VTCRFCGSEKIGAIRDMKLRAVLAKKPPKFEQERQCAFHCRACGMMWAGVKPVDMEWAD
jgi:hypothetical protein